MTIEQKLLGKNREAFDRLVAMFQSLVVKDEVEAEACETAQSIRNYYNYEGAFESNDTFFDYDITVDLLKSHNFSQDSAEYFAKNIDEMQSFYNLQEPKFVALLQKFRKQRTENYIEQNAYYRPFLGLPASESEYIEVTNYDNPLVKLYLHEVNNSTPKTKQKLFFEREIEKYKKQYSYSYLRFIESPFSPYEIRNKENFAIIYYDATALEAEEKTIFFEAYYTARREIFMHDYVEAFAKSYNAYNVIMYSFILFYTFNLYCTKSLDRYAVRNYTKEEIYDILDSNGLGNLKNFDISLLRNLVSHLTDLKQYIGTPKVIDYILDIINDKSINIKRLYLSKKYNIDPVDRHVEIDKDSFYDKSVELIFKEKIIKEATDKTDQTLKEDVHSYESIVSEDKTWGGFGTKTTNKKYNEASKRFKKEILSKSFSTIPTKYLILNKVIDIYKIVLDMNHKVGLYYQIMEERNFPIRTATAYFEGYEVTPISIYAAWCYLYGYFNGLTEPEYIVSDASTIEGVMKLRNFANVEEMADELSSYEIDLGDGFKRTIGTYLTRDEIKEYIVYFTYSQNTPIQDIIGQYERNYKIIKAIETKLESTNDLFEYEVWHTIKKANIISKNIKKLFDGYTNYIQYITHYDPAFYVYIKEKIAAIEKIETTNSRRYKAQFKLLESLKNAFSTFLKNSSKGTVYLSDTVNDLEENNIGNLKEISQLFHEFMSIYNVLHKTSYTIQNDNNHENALFLLYFVVHGKYITESSDTIGLDYDKLHSLIQSHGGDEELGFIYRSLMFYIMRSTETLFLEYDKTADHFEENSFAHLFDLDYATIHDKTTVERSESLGFTFIQEE